MTAAIRPKPGILDIALYEGGKASAAGAANPVKLSSNENPFGPSPKAIAAYQAAAGQLHRYPSTDHGPLRRAIGAVHGLDPDRIICGVGSDEVLQWLFMAYAGPGDEVIHSEHGFLMYKIGALAVGATPVEVKERERVTDVDAILAAVTERTRLVFLANPNNPTATMIGSGEMARLAAALPASCLLVLDGAYAEFVEGYDGGIALVEAHPNVVMTRTFSKLYGLGGLRIGWGYARREIIDVLNRIRQPFNLSEAQMQTAIAAVEDRDWAEKCLSENARLRAMLQQGLAEAGVPSDTSCANFVLARFADPTEAHACDEWLQKDGLIVRQVAGYGLPHCLRITVGDEEACRRVIASVAAFKGTRR